MLRIGIDVGGTHTDAVLMEGDEVIVATKALTTPDVITGILNALESILGDAPTLEKSIQAVMLGTTQFTNAVVERRELAEVAAVRIGLPSGAGIPPKSGWPADISSALGDAVYMLHGGYLFDGWKLAELDDREIRRMVGDLRAKKIRRVAIASAFSPMNPAPELAVANAIQAGIPGIEVSMSHRIGRLGIIERENASLLNASLLSFAERVVSSFIQAITARGMNCRFFVSQNDGTLMDAEFAKRFPVLTFASGPTNSLRGASKLSGLSEAIVVDIGGTTSDIGVLRDGFPRESNVVIEVGGVRTNFRMPDILSIGLGGGSYVRDDGSSVGPQSVGHNLVTDGLVFGGNTLTATDVVVASGNANIGDSSNVRHLDEKVISNTITTIQSLLNNGIEKMKPSSEPIPVLLVGGGALVVTKQLGAASRMLRPNYSEVANAIGAAIAQIGGEAEKMISYMRVARDDAIQATTAEARQLAIEAGADADSLRVADVEETSISYMDGDTTRVRVKVVGDIAGLT